MKVLILGSNGMLGRYMYNVFCNELGQQNVIGHTRKMLDLSCVNEKVIVDFVKETKATVIVNCAGVIKPRVDDVGILNTIKINSILPHILSNIGGTKLIHVTTDCVYSGSHDYHANESTLHDPLDVYGKTKSLGEPTNSLVIRTSIIGEEVGDGRSLISWAKKNFGKEVNGFTGHLWNGVTCLELSKIIVNLVLQNKIDNKIIHVFSKNIVNKYELLTIINKTYDLNMKINSVFGGICNRTLTTNQEILCNNTIQDQLLEMKNFKF